MTMHFASGRSFSLQQMCLIEAAARRDIFVCFIDAVHTFPYLFTKYEKYAAVSKCCCR